MFSYIPLLSSSALARVVSAFTTCALLSTVCGKDPVLRGTGKDRMGRDGSALCIGMFGDIQPKQSSKHPPELQENLGT